MGKNELKMGSILSFLQMGLNILIGLLYTPIMIRLLGQSEYGLYNTVSSTIAMLSILSLGFNSSYVKFYASYKQQKDRVAVYKLNGLFLLIFLIIGCIALVSGLILSGNLEVIFHQGLTMDEYKIAQVLMVLMTISLAISFPMSVFSSIISANEKFIFLKLLGMLNTVLGPLVTLPLLLIGYRSIMMVLISLIISLLTNTLYVYYVLKVLKQKFVFHDFEKGLFRNLFIYTFFLALNLIVDQINSNIDKVLLGRYKGTSVVAVYSVGYSLYAYYTLFSTSISNVFTPRIHNIVNQTKDNLVEQRIQLTELFSKVGRIQCMILGMIASGFLFWGKYFISEIWVGCEYSTSYYVALLLIFPASIALIQNIGIEIQRAQNKHKFRSIAYMIMATINLVVSIYLCQLYGAIGSAIGTALSFLIANGLILNFYYHQKCNINIGYFWKEILKLLKGMIIPLVIGAMMRCYFNLHSLSGFVLQIAIYVIVYTISMYYVGLNHYEKNLIRSIMKLGAINDSSKR